MFIKMTVYSSMCHLGNYSGILSPASRRYHWSKSVCVCVSICAPAVIIDRAWAVTQSCCWHSWQNAFNTYSSHSGHVEPIMPRDSAHNPAAVNTWALWERPVVIMFYRSLLSAPAAPFIWLPTSLGVTHSIHASHFLSLLRPNLSFLSGKIRLFMTYNS